MAFKNLQKLRAVMTGWISMVFMKKVVYWNSDYFKSLPWKNVQYMEISHFLFELEKLNATK